MKNSDIYYKYLKNSDNITLFAAKIKKFVFIDQSQNPIEKVLSETPKSEQIRSFHGTFLSNFYVCPVTYNEKIYPSPEHAYQAAKFSLINLDKISKIQIETIQEFLKEKGYAEELKSIAMLFTSKTVTSGMIKRIAEILRDFGLQRDDWDDELRMDNMIPLLIQKFKDPFLAAKLIQTGERVLIEGNEWNDTFWGVCNNQGKNNLGRIIMQIRLELMDN